MSEVIIDSALFQGRGFTGDGMGFANATQTPKHPLGASPQVAYLK